MIDLRNISACLITKDPIYPARVLQHVSGFGFGEILVLTGCDSPHRKHELFNKAKHEWLYYQDDDAICPVGELAEQAENGIITCAMKPFHLAKYAKSRIALLGWGSIFQQHKLASLDLYREKYGEDLLYKRETERILTYLNYPQKRLELPILDLPSAFAPDRLSNQPGHYDFIPQVEERCASLISP
jgi:hypothetical protein